MSPLMTTYQRKQMIRQFNQMVKGMRKVTVQRKQKKSETGIEPGFEVITVYENLNCDLQNIKPSVRLGFLSLPTGVGDAIERICFLSRFLDNAEMTEITILEDDIFLIGDEELKVMRVDPYEDHLEVVCEPKQA